MADRKRAEGKVDVHYWGNNSDPILVERTTLNPRKKCRSTLKYIVEWTIEIYDSMFLRNMGSNIIITMSSEIYSKHKRLCYLLPNMSEYLDEH